MQLVTHTLSLDTSLNVNDDFKVPLQRLLQERCYGNFLLYPYRPSCVLSVRRFHITPIVHHRNECCTRVQRSEDAAGQSVHIAVVLSKVALETCQVIESRRQILPQFDLVNAVLAATDEYQPLPFVRHARCPLWSHLSSSRATRGISL